ncbi:unnamed protein product [Acanthocheilonema viteae]|uniref:Uncharacterized protein n=1 Tax=Acanthocheilonema viteae TaxID=6277 RepID=A0A498SIU7_ACAVI|nr:unnamed protein product [Acanthocheilonema viteae]
MNISCFIHRHSETPRRDEGENSQPWWKNLKRERKKGHYPPQLRRDSSTVQRHICCAALFSSAIVFVNLMKYETDEERENTRLAMAGNDYRN